METTIKVGDKVRIKDNLMDELVRVGFNRNEMGSFVDRFQGSVETAYDVYQDDDEEREWFVTVDMCCEIPIAACELVAD